jgi:8-amino-7-oxononanoate synthase
MLSPESNPIPHSDLKVADNLTNKPIKSSFWNAVDERLQGRAGQGLFRQCQTTHPINATLVQRNDRPLINFGANDYLGMSWHPALQIDSLCNAKLTQRFGSGASPIVTGHSSVHQTLTQAICDFEQTESSIVFSSGYAANVGTVSALASRDDILFSDSLNHASLIDGCRLSRAKVIVYPHADIEALESLVKEHRHSGSLGFIVTDSVFSMDGDHAPLTQIDDLCQQFDMQCILDEAHATGVYGGQGRGLLEHFEGHCVGQGRGLSEDRFVRVGTLSKAIGCVGGFVAGPRPLIDLLSNFARSWIYSTAGTLPNAMAAVKSLSIVSQMTAERQRLARTSSRLRQRIEELGYKTSSSDSPIIPIYLGDPQSTVNASEQLSKHGLFVPAIRPPTVPRGQSLLRISLSIAHSDEQLEQLLTALNSCHRP